MKNRVIIRILMILCITLSVYGASVANKYSIAVAQTIGYAISHQNIQLKTQVHADTGGVQRILNSYLKDRSFKFKFMNILLQKQKKKMFFIKGIAVYTDKLGRSMDIKFKAKYELVNQRLVSIKYLKLKNISRPKGVFFIVPSNKMRAIHIRNLTFNRAFQRVYSISKKLNSFNVGMDILPVNYSIVVFIMNRLNSEDKTYAVFSKSPYDQQGKIAKSINTKDGWRVLMLNAKFRYNGKTPMYLNLLWKKDGYLVPLESYSTQGLIKSMQIVLDKKGYDVGEIDGRLNNKTQKAIHKYLVSSGFDKKSRMSDALLWFMQQYSLKNISKIVQSTLLLNGINIGSVDGYIGSKTIKGIKRYQRKFGLRGDGRITPELVRLLIQTSKNVDIYSYLKNYFNKPVVINDFLGQMWPNEL
ncbi:MAG: peptidoglycan-binding protein [Campylobacteraceae bacterium]|nr:peptidoglycan-binding protein [Campylobacteraceae bacterium]